MSKSKLIWFVILIAIAFYNPLFSLALSAAIATVKENC